MAKIKEEKEYEVKTLFVSAEVRYWEDASVDGAKDVDGLRIPCRNGDNWEPIIDIDSGIIINWEKGKSADINYKVCDAGVYKLLDKDGKFVLQIVGYVPEIMCPEPDGFGDYIIMYVTKEGKIENWKVSLDDFLEKE